MAVGVGTVGYLYLLSGCNGYIAVWSYCGPELLKEAFTCLLCRNDGWGAQRRW